MSLEHSAPGSPWAEFLAELDAVLPTPVQLHCVGGFVAKFLYGLPRPTGDVDYVSVFPSQAQKELQEIAGLGSSLSKRFRLQLQYVAVNALPEGYHARLVEMFPGRFKKLRLYGLDPYDLVLSKLERNSPKDREDVQYLARTRHLDPRVLRERYERELRPYLANEERHDLTLKLWLSYFERDAENMPD